MTTEQKLKELIATAYKMENQLISFCEKAIIRIYKDTNKGEGLAAFMEFSRRIENFDTFKTINWDDIDICVHKHLKEVEASN